MERRYHGWMWADGAHAPDTKGNWAPDKVEYDSWVASKEAAEGDRQNFRGYHFTRLPNKQQMREATSEVVLRGLRPPTAIIEPETKVLALGSCFAANFAEWLARNGYNWERPESCDALLRNPFENVLVVAQQFRWAFGELDPSNLYWINREKERIFATDERRDGMQKLLSDTEVFVITLTLSELWYDKQTGEPLWRVAPMDMHDPDRHGFKVLSCADTIAAFETIERIRAQWIPESKIIYTVSPMPLMATFRNLSPLVASSASKAIVRASLDEFLRGRDDFNQQYFYFPGYEIVTAMTTDPFVTDNQHLHDYIIDGVLQLFAETYTSSHLAAPKPAWLASIDAGGPIQITLRENEELKKLCDARLALLESKTNELSAIFRSPIKFLLAVAWDKCLSYCRR